MQIFELPSATVVNRVVPKNSFEEYTTPRQRKLFSQSISKITWLNKLSKDTLNLDGSEVQEIQIFLVDLKEKMEAESLFLVMDKSIPYHIIFLCQFENFIQLRASVKHPHPINPGNSVVDWTFKSEWFLKSDNPYSLNLQGSLDRIFFDFCTQLSGFKIGKPGSLSELVALKSSIHKLEREVATLKAAIKSTKEFKKKVELNLMLLQREEQLRKVIIN